MNKIKRRSMLIAMVAILFVFMTQPTVAFYTTIGTATNVVTSGSIQLVIHETTADGSPFPVQGVYIMPGDIVSKIVSIENDCTHPFYLRVKLVDGINSEELSSEDCFGINEVGRFKWKEGVLFKIGQTAELAEDEKEATKRYRKLARVLAED